MSEWISIEDEMPNGDCLVYLEENHRGQRKIHAANFHKNIVVIGQQFEFDMPKVTHWMPLPETPK